MAQLKVIRHSYAAATIGTLFVNDEFFCYSLEDRVRLVYNSTGHLVGQKLPTATAIPANLYNIRVSHSPRFSKKLIEVLDVPQFTGVRIHGGNDPEDTDGCILVARNAYRRSIGGEAVALSRQLTELVTEDLDSTLEIIDDSVAVRNIWNSPVV